jgi:hypothetical protein
MLPLAWCWGLHVFGFSCQLTSAGYLGWQLSRLFCRYNLLLLPVMTAMCAGNECAGVLVAWACIRSIPPCSAHMSPPGNLRQKLQLLQHQLASARLW